LATQSVSLKEWQLVSMWVMQKVPHWVLP